QQHARPPRRRVRPGPQLRPGGDRRPGPAHGIPRRGADRDPRPRVRRARGRRRTEVGMTTTDRLTALDASFVWFEHPGTPVHVGAVATFEAGPLLDGRGRLRLADLRERLVARLGAVPRLRRRLAPVPFGLDR